MDNKMDAVSRRRHVHGVTHPRHKLTPDQVLAIRAAVGRYKDIAAQFGVHASTVGFIRTNRTWKHV
jgi:hypothetical protein